MAHVRMPQNIDMNFLICFPEAVSAEFEFHVGKLFCFQFFRLRGGLWRLSFINLAFPGRCAGLRLLSPLVLKRGDAEAVLKHSVLPLIVFALCRSWLLRE